MSDDLDELTKAEQRGYANAMEAERKLHEDRIEQLERENARLGAGWSDANFRALDAGLKLAKAVEALRPFADQAYTFDSDGKEFVPGEFMPAIVTHNIGDLRYARTVLAELEGRE